MYFSTMVDMAKTPDEAKKDIKESFAWAEAVPGGPSVPKYPYGLCISFDEETLSKLKLGDDMPAVGEMIHLCAMAKVTSAKQEEMEQADGTTKVCRRVELQITHLATESEDEENERSVARQSRFYGGDKAA